MLYFLQISSISILLLYILCVFIYSILFSYLHLFYIIFTFLIFSFLLYSDSFFIYLIVLMFARARDFFFRTFPARILPHHLTIISTILVIKYPKQIPPEPLKTSHIPSSRHHLYNIPPPPPTPPNKQQK
jgi:hypothetical protein